MANLRDIGTQINVWLRAESSVTSLLDTIGTSPAIIVNNIVHEDYQDLDLLQIYRTSVLTPAPTQSVTYTVNCRSSTDLKADTLAQAVYDVLNRKLSDGKLAKCTVNPCIYEETNHYNTPIDVVVFNNL